MILLLDKFKKITKLVTNKNNKKKLLPKNKTVNNLIHKS